MTRRILAGSAAILFLCIATLNLAAGRSDVADAAMKGDKATIRTLIRQKADINAPQVDGATALHWAVYKGDLEMVDLLITSGARVNVTNTAGVTPLHMASLYGHASIIERLLKSEADAKARGPAGETLLMLASRNGNPEAVKLLIAAGADVNAREPLRGTTALMWAVEQRHPGAVKALLDAGADFKARTAGAGLPRNYMAGRVNVNAVEAAAKRQMTATANGRTYEQQLAIEGVGGRFGGTDRSQLQAGQPGAAAAAAGQQGNRGQRGGAQGAQGNRGGQPAAGAAPQPAPARAAATQPAGAGAQPAAAQPAAAQPDDNDDDFIFAGLVGTGGGGLTALILAAREGELESAKLLLDKGADINQVTEYGWTPLLTAANNRNYTFAKYLIDRGADVNLANKGGWTPLYLATDNRNIEGGDFPVPKPDMDHFEFIKLLLERGANPNAKVKDNTLTRTIFTMQWFLESGSTPFIRASQSSDVALMKLLLAHGADAKATTDHGDTALTAAGGIGWVEGVTYEHSVKANVEAVKVLLDLGLDPNAANRDGRTALMAAAMKGRTEVIQMLVDHGAKLDQRDKGSRDTDTVVSVNAGHTWQAVDYADGLVRTGVQSAVTRPEAAALLRKLMGERGMAFPPINRTVDSVCIVEICKERIPLQIQQQQQQQK
jgi:ankyrin repeat protein